LFFHDIGFLVSVKLVNKDSKTLHIEIEINLLKSVVYIQNLIKFAPQKSEEF